MTRDPAFASQGEETKAEQSVVKLSAEPTSELMRGAPRSRADIQIAQSAEPLPEKNTFISYPPAPMARPATPTSTAPATSFFKRFQLASASPTSPNPTLLGSNRDRAHGGPCATSSTRTVDKVNCTPGVDVVAEPVLDSRKSFDCPPDSPECMEVAEKVVGSPSVGSAEHELGTCFPCAWYWKPDGCRNGTTCSYCHVCDVGTRKAMKKAKVMKLRAQETTGHEGKAPAYVSSVCESPLPAAEAPSGNALLSLSDTMALFDEMEKDRFMNITPVKVQVKNTFIQFDADSTPAGPPVHTAPGDFFRRCFQTRQVQEADTTLQTSPLVQETGQPSLGEPAMPALSLDPVQCPSQSSLPLIQGTRGETTQTADRTILQLDQTIPSSAHTGAGETMIGLRTHALGQCTPCAYYWYKKDGCRLEAECKFCHSCQKGEIKKRKKHRIHHLKVVGAFIPGYAQIQRELQC